MSQAFSASVNFTVAVVVTGPTITSPASGALLATSSVVVTWGSASGGTAPYTYQISYDNGASWNTPTTQSSDTHTYADAVWTVRIRATDSQGVQGVGPARSFTVSTGVPPAPIIDSGPAGSTSSTTATFTFHESAYPNPVQFLVSLDGSAFTIAPGTVTYTGLTVAAHTFRVKAQDTVNGLIGTVTPVTWNVVVSPPPFTMEYSIANYGGNLVRFEHGPGSSQTQAYLGIVSTSDVGYAAYVDGGSGLASQLGRAFTAVGISAIPSATVSPDISYAFLQERKFTYQSGHPAPVAPDTATSGTFWASIANGAYDSAFLTFFNAIRADRRWTNQNPFYYCFHPDQYQSSTGLNGVNAGTALDYKAAHTRVYNLMKSSLAHVSNGGNMLLTFTVHWRQLYHDANFGNGGTGTSEVNPYIVSLIDPGPGLYDVAAANIYTLTGETFTASDQWAPLRAWALARGKPFMVAEVGYDGTDVVTYLQDMNILLNQWGGGEDTGECMAVIWLSRVVGSSDFRIDKDATRLAEFVTRFSDPVLRGGLFLDKRVLSTGATTTITSLSTGGLSQSLELAINAIAWDNPSVNVFAASSGWTAIDQESGTGTTLAWQNQIVRSVNPLTAAGTVGSTAGWASALVTYRLASASGVSDFMRDVEIGTTIVSVGIISATDVFNQVGVAYFDAATARGTAIITASDVYNTTPQTAPVITSGPGDGSVQGAGSFTWTWNAVSGATGYSVALDGGAFTAIGNVLTYTRASQVVAGSFIFQVRATNVSGAGPTTTINYSIAFNNLPVRLPTVEFPQSDWVSTNPELGRIDAIRFDSINNIVYVGGNFTQVKMKNGTLITSPASGPCNYLVAINWATQELITTWNPNPNGRVYDIQISSDGSLVYVTGNFTSIGSTSVTRSGLAALNAANANHLATVNGAIPNYGLSPATGRAVQLSSDGRYLIVAGNFTSSNVTGFNPTRMMKLDFQSGGGGGTGLNSTQVTGTPGFYDPNQIPGGTEAQKQLGRVDALYELNGVAYVGGNYSHTVDTNGTDRAAYNYIAAYRTDTNALITTWRPSLDGRVYAIKPSPNGTEVWVTGTFTGGLRAFNALTGPTDTSASVEPYNLPQANVTCRDVVVQGSAAWVCGDFTTFGGATHNRIVRLKKVSGVWSVDSAFTASISTGTAKKVVAKSDGTKIVVGGDIPNAVVAFNGASGAAGTFGFAFPGESGSQHCISMDANDSMVAFGGDFGPNSVVCTDWNGGGPNHYSNLIINTGGAGFDANWYHTCDGNIQALEIGVIGTQTVLFCGHHGGVAANAKDTSTGASDPASRGLFTVPFTTAGGSRLAYGEPPSFIGNSNTTPLKLFAIHQSATTQKLHAGGDFNIVNGSTADVFRRYARFEPTGFVGGGTAPVTTWVPTPNAIVRDAYWAPATNRLVIVGDFTSVNGTATNAIAAIDTS